MAKCVYEIIMHGSWVYIIEPNIYIDELQLP